MELTLISENKIKISLTKEDMEGYRINADDLDYDNTETRRLFWTLLDEARIRTGFDAAKNRIFIQIYPCCDGSCELYVSKIGADEKEQAVRAEQKRKKERIPEPFVYLFDGIQPLISACRRLRESGYGEGSSAYSEGEDCFFLSYYAVPEQYLFIDEYGERQDADSTLLYIREHCTPICVDDAVERLGQL